MNARRFDQMQLAGFRRPGPLPALAVLGALLSVLLLAPGADSQAPGYVQVSGCEA